MKNNGRYFGLWRVPFLIIWATLILYVSVPGAVHGLGDKIGITGL